MTSANEINFSHVSWEMIVAAYGLELVRNVFDPIAKYVGFDIGSNGERTPVTVYKLRHFARVVEG